MYRSRAKKCQSISHLCTLVNVLVDLSRERHSAMAQSMLTSRQLADLLAATTTARPVFGPGEDPNTVEVAIEFAAITPWGARELYHALCSLRLKNPPAMDHLRSAASFIVNYSASRGLNPMTGAFAYKQIHNNMMIEDDSS